MFYKLFYKTVFVILQQILSRHILYFIKDFSNTKLFFIIFDIFFRTSNSEENYTNLCLVSTVSFFYSDKVGIIILFFLEDY